MRKIVQIGGQYMMNRPKKMIDIHKLSEMPAITFV
jgi:hypothetical protein